MNYKIFKILLFAISVNSWAQHELYIGPFLDGGIPQNNISSQKEVLKPTFFPTQFQIGLHNNYRFGRIIGIDFGISQNKRAYKMVDKSFNSKYPDYKSKIKNTFYYTTLYTGLQVRIPIDKYSGIYLTGGYALNNVKRDNLTQEKSFIIGNEDLTVRSTYNWGNYSLYGELGYQMILSNDHQLLIGIKANFGQNELQNIDYNISSFGNMVANDQVVSRGNFIGLSLKYGIKIFNIDKKSKTKTTGLNRGLNNTPQNTPPQQTPAKKVEGRDVKVTHKITVKGTIAKVEVWDHQREDGDKISLNLNGQWILQNHLLTKQPKSFQITLRPGQNLFVLHALNLGTLPPNTAAIKITDGSGKTQTIILESTLQESGTIEIICNQ